MENKLNLNDSRVLADEAVKFLLEKQGLEIKLYNMKEREAITEFYINVTGKSAMHTSSLADDLADKLSELGRNALRIEGKRSDTWVLVDYGDVIVNVFDKESREFYNLDRLLPTDALVDIGALIAEVDAKFEIEN